MFSKFCYIHLSWSDSFCFKSEIFLREFSDSEIKYQAKTEYSLVNTNPGIHCMSGELYSVHGEVGRCGVGVAMKGR